MLDRLMVKDLALIEKSVVEFGPGLNILTGETGAGKSILLGSIQLALGQKANKDMIRHGSEQALIELSFSLGEEKEAELKELEEDLEIEEGSLIIRRKISEKKSENRVNDLSVTLAKLREISGELLDLHGQHEHHSLLKEGAHLAILDSFMTRRGGRILSEVKEAYENYREKKKKVEAYSLPEEERKRELDFLQFELEELSSANLKPGEEEQLSKDYAVYENRDRLKSLLLRVQEELADRDFHGPVKNLEEAVTFDESLKNVLDTAYELEAVGEDCLRAVEHYLDHSEMDEEKFFLLGERLDTIRSLMMKYGGTEEKALEALSKKEERLRFLTDYEKEKALMEEALARSEEELREKAEKLSLERQKTAKELEERIQQEMQELGFLDTRFTFRFEKKREISEKGLDEVESYVSLNPGEPLRPLREVGSGGELSRIMLSIKTVLADTDAVPTLIFDEIDTGISGRTAEKVGEKLEKIAKNHQVILITHLPQIAAKADRHFLIEKNVQEGKTKTEIHALNEEASVKELARLLGGEELTEAALQNARSLKAKAKEKK
ncbi:DNA repair protein RecN [Oribacterium sp. oral taxon 108]|uniref:DNA repair protein RecN n=1 Tax=Oribacterium sp. oral taxon 108 TaxID=712414 RepID=UPI00020DD1D5|nr:DNA repair protein RecN [Oribacterium sp. oral taxon 108]EGL36802.1 DNA repair protein RecN [Oribacterium sp. oral taxon 108 str. F0425]